MFFIGHIISIRKMLRATWNMSGKLGMKLDVAQIRLVWDKSVHPQVDQLVALLAYSKSSFRCLSLRSSPSVIRCSPGVSLRSAPVPYLCTLDLLFAC